jgi:hypothetical protein
VKAESELAADILSNTVLVVAVANPEPDAEPEETAATETANARDQGLG